ncbi:MAG: DMT family transporter [Bacteroidales bacterium]|nr:DMT family transporter [Bacteroidales bacterium]
MKTSQKKAYIYAISAVLLWSTVAVSFKIALRYVNFLQLLFFASAVALFTYLIISLLSGKIKTLFTITKKELLYSSFIGFLNPFLYYVILFKAYSLLPAQIAQPLNYLWPAMLVLLSAPLLGQKLKIKSLLSVFFGFLGVYVIATQGNVFDFKVEKPFGVILAAGSSVIWALSWIFNQKDKRTGEKKLFWAFFFGLIYISISIFFFSEFKLPKLNGILAVIYVGLFEMGITFFLWLKALQITDRNDSISNLVFFSPFFALIFIHFILGENIYYTTFIGLIFIISGIFIQQIKKKQRK